MKGENMKVVKNANLKVRRVPVEAILVGESFRYLNGDDQNVYISFGPVWATANRLGWGNTHAITPATHDDRIIVGLVSEGRLFKVKPETKVIPVEAELNTYE
jgi:hypothetical protein